MQGFKGFDKDLKCRGFQYEVGGEFEEAEAIACRKGFHFCEEPLNVFNYYPPADSRYCEVVGEGKTDKDSDDSKVACTKLHVGVEIGLSGLISSLNVRKEAKILSAKKNRTPEEVIARKAEIARQKREWRKKNPDKQQAIYQRYYAKKLAAVEKQIDKENV